MKIDRFKKRTLSNPTEGVVFTAAEKAKISNMAIALSGLDGDAIVAIRSGLARQILHLEEISDWLPVGSLEEKVRQENVEAAILTYAATYEASVARLYSNLAKA